MTWEAWFTLAVMAATFAVLVSTRIGVDLVLMAALTALAAVGILPVNEAAAGFGNPALLTVGVLFVVAIGLRETGAINLIVEPLLGRPRSILKAQSRFLPPVLVLSAVMNNTPLVAIMLPELSDWARKNNFSISKLLLPLSYAAILGGTCTLIGTSTNLLVNGMLISETDHPGFGLLDIAPVGVPCAIAGLIYILLATRWLLPDRRPAISRHDDPREYTIEMTVTPGGPLVGKSIEKAGLRHLPGMYLVEIDRGENILPAVSPREVLQDNDRLIFAGVVESVVDLQKIRGLTPATKQVFKLDAPRANRMLIEAVVSSDCPVVGKTIREGQFRTRYNAAVIAVARRGKRIHKKIGDIVLEAGDTLLLEAHPSFVDQQRNSRDFFLVSAVEDSAPPRHERAWTALAILAAMVAAAATGLLDMLTAALLAGGGMLATRCCTGGVVRRNVNWQVLIAIGAALGLGRAMMVSGAAEGIASALIGLAGDRPWLVLVMIYIVTTVFTEVLTNNAAAALIFPIAVATAATLGVSPLPYVAAIMIAASAAFATPIGYQTNLMVYGPGGYRFGDFLRFGLPLDILVGIVALLVIPHVFPF